MGQAQATVAESRAQLARLEEVYRLSNRRVPSEAELQTGRATYQRAAAALKVAQANVTAGQATLAQSRTQRDRAIIRSPVAGVVLARQVDPGQTVAASFNTPTLFVIAQDLSAMQLEVAIDEADVGSVKQGQDATFTVDAFPGAHLPGKDHAGRSRLQPVGAGGDQRQHHHVDHAGAGRVLCRQPVGREREPAIAPRHDRDRRHHYDGQEQRAAGAQRRVALSPAGRRNGATGRHCRRADDARRTARRRRGERTATVGYGAQQTVYVKGEDGTPQEVRIQTGDTDGSVTEVIGGGLRAGMEVITGQLTGDEQASGGAAKAGGQRRQGGAGGGQRGQ